MGYMERVALAMGARILERKKEEPMENQTGLLKGQSATGDVWIRDHSFQIVGYYFENGKDRKVTANKFNISSYRVDEALFLEGHPGRIPKSEVPKFMAKYKIKSMTDFESGKHILMEDYEKMARNMCEVCGEKKKKKILIHHFFPQKPFKVFKYITDNGIVLCKRCHFFLHRRQDPRIIIAIFLKRGIKWYNNLLKHLKCK